MPEVDVPGHAYAWGLGEPGITVCGCDPQPARGRAGVSRSGRAVGLWAGNGGGREAAARRRWTGDGGTAGGRQGLPCDEGGGGWGGWVGRGADGASRGSGGFR